MKKAILYIAAVITLGACTKDVLDKEDKTGLGAETWDNESTATLYLNRCYSVIMPGWPANNGTTLLPYAIHNTSDESNTVGSTAILYGTLGNDGVTDFGSVSGNGALAYVNIRKVNILLEQIDKGTLSLEIRTRLKAEAYFLRAWNYFNLVKLYGGVPYITNAQQWEGDEVYVARNKTSECFDLIIKDLDSAAFAPAQMIATQGAGNRGRITNGAALALKGRVLLYWASAQFNPTKDMARWDRAYAANKAAYDTLIAQGHALFGNYANLFLDESNSNKELVMIRSYDGINLSNAYENSARPSSEGNGGGYQPTWDLVKAYPMKNGLSIADPASGYDSVYYWKGRDPRFAATIAYNGVTWALSGQSTRKQWTYTGNPNPENTVTTTGFYARKAVNPATLKVNSVMGSSDWIEIRLAEVMLNYAEAANEVGNTTEAYAMLTEIRKRAGIEAGMNELYGLQEGMSKTEMFNTIMNERRVEFAFEGKRYDDLRRTKLWDALNGTFRQKLTITVKAPYTATILNNFIPGSTTVRVRDTINIDGPAYADFFKATVSNIDAATSPINFKPEYYYYAIPNTHIGRNPNLKQTTGWTGGTFDPLQ
ncbi:MAG: RagB/SusD family nutrient uptake outer membrane protein [Ferruginibacter sp.]|nr:RagB/SusD family nutrient uptake outer membrane protein [Ferruginibacter sp.]